MQSYTSARNLAGDLTNNSSSSNLTLMDTLINLAYREILTIKDWHFLYRSETDTSVASQQFYELPHNLDRLKQVTLTVSNTVFSPRESPSRRHWELLNSSTTPKSDSPTWFFVFNDQVGFYPTLSSGSNTITLYYKIRVRDTSVADYTTGTITTATDGDETIVGSSTSWTTGMEDKYLRITSGNAASLGDGIWYQIASITDGTNLELNREYGGTSISSGTAAYILGDMFLIPEAYHQLPVYRAVEQYYTTIKPEVNQAALYKRLYQEGLDRMTRDHGSKTTGNIIEDIDRFMHNPNFFVEL